MPYPMMTCGCEGTAFRTQDNGAQLEKPIPVCATHGCTEVALERPDLTGRSAQCSYLPHGHADKPSSFDLAFFRFRGPGSAHATQTCKCGYHRVAHPGGENYRPGFKCKNGTFEPVGDKPDTYYCGCHGWD